MIIAATGHRPNKLGGYHLSVFTTLCNVADDYIEQNRPEHIISGMALGWDQAVAQVATLKGIPWTAAVPFKGQEAAWPAKSQYFYHELLMGAQRVEIICEAMRNARLGFHIRNHWMVDHCDRIMALWDGSNGGTASCIKYAQKVGRPIDNLWPQWVSAH
jgi:uncharacterized phage-like protein YoqJ